MKRQFVFCTRMPIPGLLTLPWVGSQTLLSVRSRFVGYSDILMFEYSGRYNIINGNDNGNNNSTSAVK